VRELGTFKTPSGELVRCRIDRSGRLSAYCEVGTKLVPCDTRMLLNAIKLSDDPEWLNDEEPDFASPHPGD
jgi:hypothetical protein